MSKEPQQISTEIQTLIAIRKLGYSYNNNPVPEYFFKDIETAKELIISCFLEFDPEFKRPDKKFIWLPEYDLVAKWMVNTQGRGLVLTGECGTGKSTILKHVLPLCYQTKQKEVLPVSCYDLSDPAAKFYNRAVEKHENNLVFHEVKKLRHLLLDVVGKELI
jgi:DNA replication protein DnaC